MERIYDAGDNAMMLYWSDVAEGSFDSYAASLEALGFTVYQSHETDSIVAATYTKDGTMAHVYYLKRTSELRVITKAEAELPINPYEYTKVCEPLVIQVELDPSTGYGMCYIVRLEDGTFLVIDGGFDDEEHLNAKVIYNQLVRYKPDEVEDIVITAWILTHPHGDHVGGYRGMAASEYADKITVKTLIANGTPAYLHTVMDDKDNPPNYVNEAKKFPGCRYIKANTGQRPGVTIDILYSPADVYPDFIFELNSAATITFHLTVEESETHREVRYLFIADNSVRDSDRIAEMYREDLKSDVVQAGHHGAGGSQALYEYCDADIALWPTSQARLEGGSWWKDWPQAVWLRENVKVNIAHGGGTCTMWFEGDEIAWQQDPPM